MTGIHCTSDPLGDPGMLCQNTKHSTPQPILQPHLACRSCLLAFCSHPLGLGFPLSLLKGSLTLMLNCILLKPIANQKSPWKCSTSCRKTGRNIDADSEASAERTLMLEQQARHTDTTQRNRSSPSFKHANPQRKARHSNSYNLDLPVHMACRNSSQIRLCV